MNTTRRFALVLALSLPLLPLQAVAQPASASAEPTKESKEEASRRFRRGIELFQEGDSRTALVEFKRAYELAPNFQVLYNIGNVYFQLQDYANALLALEKYLADGGSQVPAQRRSDVEKDIEKLRTRVARLNITTNVPDVDVTVDDTPVGKSPFAKPVIVNPGSHKITAFKEGRQTTSKTIEVASFDSLNVPLELPEQTSATPQPTTDTAPPLPTGSTTTTSPTTPPPPPPPAGTPAWPFWTATAAFAVGAGVTGAMAYSKSNDLAKLRDPNGSTTTREELNAAASSTKTMALVSDVLSGLTVVGLGVSLFVTVSKPSTSPAKQKTGMLQDVRVRVAPNGVHVVGSF